MRIGLNLLYLLPGVVGGTQTYAVSLIGALAALDTQNEYVLYLNRESEDLDITLATNFRRVVCPVQAASREARYAFEQLRLPALVRQDRISLLHSLGYVGPLLTPCPHVVSIMDLIYRGHQVMMTSRKQKALEFFVKQSARRAGHILTISENSKREIVADIGVRPDQVTVTYLAGRPVVPTTPPQRTQVLARYGITAPYVTAFSSPNPIKNISRLLEAFAEAGAGLPHQLVLVGHAPHGTDFAAEAAQRRLAGRVVVTGYVPDADLTPLLQGAALFAFPSLYEGFGLPVLDAQQEGVPVICSTAASLPEVAGDGAVLFDPLSVPQMRDALRAGLTDLPLRDSLAARGRANAAKFSWDKTARQTLDVYRQTARAKKRL